MFENGLLLLTSSTLRGASVSSLFKKCSEVVKNNLYVHLINSSDSLKNHSCVPYSQYVLKFINDIYSLSVEESTIKDLTFVIFNISNSDQKTVAKYSFDKSYQVVLTDINDSKDAITKYLQTYFPKSYIVGKESLPILHIQSIIKNDTGVKNAIKLDQSLLPQYDNVCMGGTFDCLHVGHKILLTQASLMAKERLVVGVTHGEMNKKKILHELMESTEERTLRVTEFLKDIKQSIKHQVVPIEEPFGPSIIDPTLNAIAVSNETLKGAGLINDKRREKGFPPLEVKAIELVNKRGGDDDDDDDHDKKISSTTSRKQLLGSLLKNPEAKNLKPRPYLIGLTGGIASGKTSISKRLEGLGAGIINCDLLGHKTYEPGTETFNKVVETFGVGVVNENGQINRAELGRIVFKDKAKLNILNSIVWPGIADLVGINVDDFAKRGKDVVVVDAAVLLEAGWDANVHEVWTTIVPPEEAEKRIMERNKLTPEQARERIQSQMSNEGRVERSNVVFCTLWEYSVTQKQVEKAWRLLQERIHI